MPLKQRLADWQYVPTSADELANERRWEALWEFLDRSLKRRRALAVNTYTYDDWILLKSVAKSEYGCGGCGVRYEVYDFTGVAWCRDDCVPHGCWGMIDRHICFCPHTNCDEETRPTCDLWDFADDGWDCSGSDYDSYDMHLRGGIDVPIYCIINHFACIDFWKYLYEPTLSDRCMRGVVRSILPAWERSVWLQLPVGPPFRTDPAKHIDVVRYAQAVLKEVRPVLPEDVYRKVFWLAHLNVHHQKGKAYSKEIRQNQTSVRRSITF